MTPNPLPTEVTRKQLADLLGLTASRVSQMQADGMPHNGKKGTLSGYPLKDCIQWILKKSNETAVQRSKPRSSQDLEANKAEKEYWAAVRMKNKALQEEGKLVTIEDSTNQITTRLIQIRDTIMTVEHKWAPFLVAKDSLAEVQGVLKEQVDGLMTTLSNLPDIEEEEEDSPLPEEEVIEDDFEKELDEDN